MKYLILILAFLMLLTNKATAEIYQVVPSVLNLRSCAGTDCKIVGKLLTGGNVYVEEMNGKWAKVRTAIGDGYVAKKYLIKSAENNPSSEGPSDLPTFVLVIILGIAVWVIWYIYFLPSRIAADNKNADKVYTVNLFLGWIPVIWLVLLFAALIGEQKNN